MKINNEISQFPLGILTYVLIGVVLGFSVNGCWHSQKPTTVMQQQPSITVERADGTRITAPADHSIELALPVPESIDKGTSLIYQSGMAKGPEVVGEADKIKEKMKAEAPKLDFGEGFVGSAGKFAFEASLVTTSGVTPFFIIGALLIVAACIAGFFFKQWAIALALFAAGFMVIGVGILIESAPWVFYLLPLAALFVLGAFVWSWLRHRKTAVASETTVNAIETPNDPITPSQTLTAATVASVAGITVEQAQKAWDYITKAIKTTVSANKTASSVADKILGN